MKTRTLVCLCGALAPWPLVEASAQAPALTPRDSALHALNRLAFGPRPGEVDRVAAEGVMRWIERQLEPGHIDDPRIADRGRAVTVIGMSREDLADRFEAARRERQERQAAMRNADTM